MIGEVPWQMWAVFAMAAVVFWLYARERWPLEAVSAGLLAVLVLFFSFFPLLGADGRALLSPEHLLAGFANTALLAVLALIVVGQGLLHSGALEMPTRWLLRHNMRPFLLLGLVLGGVFIISAFLNNTPVAVMFIPVLTALAAGLGQRAGQIMMPLSFTCILGGMTTLIGSSTNLLAARTGELYGGAMMGFFDITVPALILGVPGMLYVLFVMPRLLHGSGQADEAVQLAGGRQFVVEIAITPDNPLCGAEAEAGRFAVLGSAVMLMVERDRRALARPFDDMRLQAGDVAVIAATRNEVAQLLAENPALLGVTLPQSEENGDEGENNRPRLAESVIVPASRMTGRSMEQLDLRRETGCVALGVQRRSGYAHTAMRSLRLEAGDVLLLLGSREALHRLAHTHEALPLDTDAPALPDKTRPNLALAIFFATVISAASGLLPIVVAAFSGAAAMVATGVLNVRQAARAIDRRIFLLVSAMLGLAAALDASGGAGFLAQGLVGLLASAPPVLFLSALFLLVAVTTNLLTNNATAVLFTPIAAQISLETGLSLPLLLITVILAANCSFATPMGYQTNLLVMGPGGYQFRDYLRAGVPLVLLLWVVYSLFVPAYYLAVW